MPNRPLNVPHVVSDILQQLYPQVLWWAANLVATPQQKAAVGSPTHVEVQHVPAEQAPRILEASTVPSHKEDQVGQILDMVSTPWAPASVLALHLAAELRDPMAPCTPQEHVRTPHVPELSLAVWTAPGAHDELHDLLSPVHYG